MIKKSLVTAIAVCVAFVLTGQAAPSSDDTMSVAQQNALVQKHCAVCHTDAHMNGALSLEHFDAAHPDPTVVAMLLSKVRDGGALSAAGIPMPDKPTQDAFIAALTAEAIGANTWNVNRSQDLGTQHQKVTASIVREAPLEPNAPMRYVGDHGAPDIYRLTVICRTDTNEGEMQLSWAPGSPHKDSVMSALVDGTTRVTYRIDGSEKTFKGATGMSGEGAVILSGVKSLPNQTLTIDDIFKDGSVVFPFDGLTGAARQALSTCFPGTIASQ